ncbi:MAG: queuosine salvage family protein [Ktedonobacterales bacterium]|nr:queuosine salvage family protein [Ktedonobacterales bacterium]
MGIQPSEWLAEITPPTRDRLGVLSGTAPVVREGRLVTLDAAGIAAVAERWAATPWPAAPGLGAPGLGAPHFSDGTWRTANWVLLLDALNFCFWGEPGQPRWRVMWRGQVSDGYYALAAALARAVEDGRPLWDAAYLAALDTNTLAEILRPVSGNPPIPLFAQRLANAREVGQTLLARYEGTAVAAVAAAGHDAVALALLLARDFPSFNDVAPWGGQTVPFLKRAQICVADLRASFGGEGLGALTHLDELTAFADYKLPQLLRRWGALSYAPALAAAVDGYTPLAPASPAEVEIRAATIWAVELLRRRLETLGIAQRASAIDYRLWDESQTAAPDDRPYHRTRTLYY